MLIHFCLKSTRYIKHFVCTVFLFLKTNYNNFHVSPISILKTSIKFYTQSLDNTSQTFGLISTQTAVEMLNSSLWFAFYLMRAPQLVLLVESVFISVENEKLPWNGTPAPLNKQKHKKHSPAQITHLLSGSMSI